MSTLKKSDCCNIDDGHPQNCCGSDRKEDNTLDILWTYHTKIVWDQWKKMPVPILVHRFRTDAKMPIKSRDTDLGWDIFCVDEEDSNWGKDVEGRYYYDLDPFSSHTFKTGIKIATPENYGFLLRDRSSMGVRDITVEAGVIEGTYRGEWGIHLINLTYKSQRIYAGDKIAQAILTPIIPGKLIETNNLPESDRGSKGWGSSGC